MSWARLDDGFFRHPKARAAGRDGRALFMAGLCWSASHLTDGFIATTELGLIAAEAEVRATATSRRLVDVGLWEEAHGGWVIHDYLDFNPTAEAEREKRRKRAEAGRIGGLRSRPPASKPEANSEANASANAQADRKQIGTPSPYSTDVLTSSDHSHSDPDPPDDDDRSVRVAAALAVLAERDLAERQAQDHLPPIGDPVTWAFAAQDRRRDRDGDRLVRVAADHPDASPVELANLVEPARTVDPAGTRITSDGRQFSPGTGVLAGLPELPEHDPSVVPDWSGLRSRVQHPHAQETA